MRCIGTESRIVIAVAVFARPPKHVEEGAFKVEAKTPRSRGRISEKSLKRISSSSSFLAFAFLLVICCSGILPALSLPVSQTISSYGTVAYSRAIQVPPDGYCYHAAFVSLTSRSALSPADAITAINYFTNITGKGLYLYNNQATLMMGEDLWMCMPSATAPVYGSNDYATLIQEGLIQGIMIGLWTTVRNDLQDGNLTVEQIVNGTWDTYLTTIADEAKAFGYPIFLRIGQEMNINQGEQGGSSSLGDNATAFVIAWQRIVDIFRNEGASNVVFVWNPNCDDIGPNHWTDYYPGDGYVDWVGIDLYQYQPNSDPNTMLQIYNDYSSQKPVMICEWGANWEGQNYTDQSRATFVNNFFDAIEARHDIKMISYQYGGDFMFDPVNFPLTTSAYQNRISNSRYIVQPLQG